MRENGNTIDREARGSRLETPPVDPSYVTLRPMPDGYGGIHKQFIYLQIALALEVNSLAWQAALNACSMHSILLCFST